MGATTNAEGDGGDALAGQVARKLAALRNQRNLSLEHLARLSGVSRAMLWQIESARSAPTIKVLSRVADALGVSLSALLEEPTRADVAVLSAQGAKWLRSADGRYQSRALFPYAGMHSIEFYEIRIDAGGGERAEPHAAGTEENLVVCAGHVEIDVGPRTFALAPGDALQFRADVAHAYRNVGDAQVVIYLVVSHPAQLNHG